MSTRTLALVLAAVTLAGFGTLMGLRDSLSWSTGDEGTYMAMAKSLAYDGDLVFSAPDLERIEAAASGGQKELILQRTARGITYSKPVLYAIAASPLTWIAGNYGPVLLNVLALLAAFWLTERYLRRLGRRNLWITLVTFIGASSLVPYLVWRMSDSFLVSCALAGLVLSLASVRKSKDSSLHGSPFLDSHWATFGGGLLLGAVATMRYPNALLAVTAFVALIVMAKWTRAAVLLLGVASAVSLVLGLTIWLTGSADPYRSARSTFNETVGYPDGPDSEVAVRQLGGLDLATVKLRPRPVSPRVIAYSGLYFLAGRHTGLLIYFPLTLLLVIGALRHVDRVGLVMLAGVAGVVGFYLFFLPHNYFGGGAAIGNRYFLPAYPALLIALPRLPKPRWLILPWLVAALALGSAVLSAWETRDAPKTSQSHAHAGLFRVLPFESTLQSIEGSKERFWLHDWSWEMLRFNDPFSRVGKFSFHLESGDPAAEIEVANTRVPGPMRFLVLSDAPAVILDYSDWKKSEAFELARPMGTRGLFEVLPSSSWRRHQFWFPWQHTDVFQARVFRLALRTPDGSPATAEVRYLGQASIPEDIYSFELVGSELPTLSGARTTSSVTVTVRNTSSEVWKSDRVLAVNAGYKLFFRTASGVEVIEGPRTPLPVPVAPGETVTIELDIHWPAPPRNYGLAIDLIHEGIAWFEEKNGSPVARAEVKVISLPKAEPLPQREP